MTTHPSAARAPSTHSTTSSVRRNLFSVTRRAPSTTSHPHPTSRPTSSAASYSHEAQPVTTEDATNRIGEDNEILVQGESGGYTSGFAVEMLVKALKVENRESDGEDDGEGSEGDGMGGMGKVDTRLIEMYRGSSHGHVDPAELRAAVQASLLQKVASLEDDRWMFEREDDAEAQM